MLFLVVRIVSSFTQDNFSGKYYMMNQADYVNEKRWLEITRNKYQEVIVNSDGFDNCIAYYDEINKELFFVIERSAQYNTLMKIKILDFRTIEIYSLVNSKWQKSSDQYTLLENKRE